MYDFNRQSNPSLCAFSSQSLCVYLSHSRTLRFLQPKAHHYLHNCHITQLLQTITRQLFYYSSSNLKTTSKEEQHNVLNILLQNLKKIVVYNIDQNGLIIEQKILYLALSFLHSRHNKIPNLQEFLQEVHFLLTSNMWQNPAESIPASLLMLLNGQFEELLHYAKRELLDPEDPTVLEQLMDMLVYKIEQAEFKSHGIQGTATLSHIDKIVTQVGKSNWLKLLLTEIKKRDLNIKAQVVKQSLILIPQRKHTPIFSLFQTKHQIEILLAVLCGDLELIKELSKGSWGIYLNLYINFVETLPSNPKHPYETVVRVYLENYFAGKKSAKKPTEEQEEVFLIKLLNAFSPQNRFSFHEIYQSSFAVFSPILSNLLGLLMIECKMIDAYCITNNRDYHEDVLLALIDNCSKVGWTALVHMIGFVQNSSTFRDCQGKETMWENLMFQYLPYELSQSENSVQNQVKEIEEKLEDLNLVGLSSFTKTYLNTLFDIQLKQSHNKLNEMILEVFFLCLQMSESSNANYCFHQMKTFLSRYYRTRHFDYDLITSLESIFERKQSILSEKMEHKIQKLFCLIYKIQGIYQIATSTDKINQNHSKQLLLRQLAQFNKMFSSSKKKKPLSLCIQLLRLSAYLHSRVENILNIGAEQIPQMAPQTQELNSQKQLQFNSQLSHQLNSKQQSVLNTVRQFEWNLHNYLAQWNLSKESNVQLSLSDEALEQLAYFDKYFY